MPIQKKDFKSKHSLYLIASIALISASGCTTLRTNVMSFQGPEHQARGTIDVFPLNDEQSNSLSWNAHRERLLSKLIEVGYSPPKQDDLPDFFAVLRYQIDNGRDSATTVPLYGQTGGGSSISTGTISGGYGSSYNYSAYTTRSPQFGVVGATTIKSTAYTRDVFIDIRRFSKSNTKAYGIRARSVGECGNIDAVIPFMLDAIFRNFPLENGKSTAIEIDAKDLDC